MKVIKAIAPAPDYEDLILNHVSWDNVPKEIRPDASEGCTYILVYQHNELVQMIEIDRQSQCSIDVAIEVICEAYRFGKTGLQLAPLKARKEWLEVKEQEMADSPEPPRLYGVAPKEE